MDLIDYLKIYKARTIPKPPDYFYAPSTKAVLELNRWPSKWPPGPYKSVRAATP
jgi:hypothetical protein